MKKFRAVYKKKQELSESLNEQNVLTSFKNVYNALLEKYDVTNYTKLSKDYQNVFLAELNSYWDDQQGLLERGKSFLEGSSDMLNESSTVDQKKAFLKKRSVPVISETFRQSGLKYRLYDIIDKVYKETNANKLSEVMSAKELTEIMVESFKESVKEIMTEIKFELHESTVEQPKKKDSSELNERKVSTKKQKPISTNEAFGRDRSPRKEAVSKLLDWLAEEGIQAKGDKEGFIRDDSYNVIASVTPLGYVYIAGADTFAPEELDSNKSDIMDAMKMHLGGGYN